MTKQEWVESEIGKYEAKNGELPAHNRGVLRSMYEREWNFWEREGRDYLTKDTGEQLVIKYNN